MRWLKIFCLSTVIALPLAPSINAQNLKHQKQDAPAEREQYSAPDQRGTDKSPLAVKLLNTGKSDQETAQQTAQVQNENNSEWWMRVLTLALVGVGFLQLIAFIVQAMRLKETIGVMHDTSERQLRAYLCVLAGAEGSTIEQNEERNSRLEIKPIINNSGQTPAYNVNYRARATICDVPLPRDFTFPLAAQVAEASSAVIGANQSQFMVIGADNMYGPTELTAIKAPSVAGSPTRRLVVYGIVNYTDAFKKPQYTNFCFYILWGSKGVPVTMTYSRHTDAS
jgi:hypothetical protein